MASVTEVLKQAIRKSGLSDRRLGMLTGIHRQSIGRFMAGQTGLRLDQIDKLAEFFGLVAMGIVLGAVVSLILVFLIPQGMVGVSAAGP